MTRNEKLDECLEFYFKQGHSYDLMDYRKGWGVLNEKYSTELEGLIFELKQRRFILNVNKGIGKGYVTEISGDGEKFYSDGGFISEENKKTEIENLHIKATKATVEALPVAKEANEISRNANRIASNANILSFIAIGIAIGSLIVAIIAVAHNK